MDMNLAIAAAFLMPRYGKEPGPWDWESRFTLPEPSGLEKLIGRAIVRSAAGIGSTVTRIARSFVRPSGALAAGA